MFKEELRHEYPLTEDSVVFDIGGYKGEWAKIIYDRYKSRIYCFEPVFKIENDDIEIYPIGLGGHGRKEDIRIAADATGIYCNAGESQNITIVDIMRFIQGHMIEKIDLMKINIEGMEYELLTRLLDADFVKNITDIQVQFHRSHTKSDEMMWNIQDKLKKTHYPTYQFRYVWENWRLK